MRAFAHGFLRFVNRKRRVKATRTKSLLVRHSREGGNPEAFKPLNAKALDSRLRGNDAFSAVP